MLVRFLPLVRVTDTSLTQNVLLPVLTKGITHTHTHIIFKLQETKASEKILKDMKGKRKRFTYRKNKDKKYRGIFIRNNASKKGME